MLLRYPLFRRKITKHPTLSLGASTHLSTTFRRPSVSLRNSHDVFQHPDSKSSGDKIILRVNRRALEMPGNTFNLMIALVRESLHRGRLQFDFIEEKPQSSVAILYLIFV